MRAPQDESIAPPPAPLRVHLTPLPCPRAPSGALFIMFYFHTLYLRHFLENISSPISPLRKKSYIPLLFLLFPNLPKREIYHIVSDICLINMLELLHPAAS